ncbi:MAG: thrombospondin type 3 repeat-containing protein [Planctomycetota bacterium]|nr:thrombospondin type 3 repeat-containing protein [Planctomycetota bacterium]
MAGSGIPLFGAAVAAFALVAVVGGERRLAADVDPGTDPDGDFLSNVQEQILGTSANQADTDHDGFSDLEELARGTSPLSANQIPTSPSPVHVGMTAHAGANGKVHVLVAVHSTLANPGDIQLGFGVQMQRRLITLSNTWVASNSTSQVTTGAGGQSLLHLIDIEVDAAPILAAGQLTFYATAGVAGAGTVLSADTVRFLNVGGVLVLVMAPPRPSNGQQTGVGSLQPGSIYVPLPTDGSGGIPATWSSGEVCFQRSSPVAINGPIVTQEVVSASCVEGWDGYCPPTCTASVGSTYSTIDPIGLIGG